MDQILAFLGDMGDYQAREKAYQEAHGVELFFEESDDPAPELPELSGGIRELVKKDARNISEEESVRSLYRDLHQVVRCLGGENGARLRLGLNPVTEEDDQGDAILVGVQAKAENGRMRQLYNRVCPRCGKRVFAHAGTSEHRTVVFVGAERSGKTSTILALTDYALNGMQFTPFEDSVWSGAEQIGAVRQVELLTPDRGLREDLARYRTGIGLAKAAATRRSDAYCATLRITAGEERRRRIVTLMDFPGELMSPEGKINQNAVLNDFPVALNCDAMVICMDSRMTGQSADSLEQMRGVFAAADELQKLRIGQGAKGYVPTMLLYNKCDALESGLEKPRDYPMEPHSQQELMYMLLLEQEAMRDSKRCRMAEELFAQTGDLGKAFRASMRCCPYGYDAPGVYAVQEGQPHHSPRPIHVDKLMKWLLTVAGCIPAEILWAPSVEKTPGLERFCLERPQYRQENPIIRDGVSLEAYLRCILFCNPGVHDLHLAGSPGGKMKRLIYKLRMAPDSNG